MRCHGTSSGSGALPVNCPAVVDVRLASSGVAIIGTFCLWQKPVGVPLEAESVGIGDGDLSVDGVVFPTSREPEYRVCSAVLNADQPTGRVLHKAVGAGRRLRHTRRGYQRASSSAAASAWYPCRLCCARGNLMSVSCRAKSCVCWRRLASRQARAK